MVAKKSRISQITVLVLFAFILLASSFYPRWEKTGTEANIAWDVLGYYLYLPSIFIYHDLEKVAFLNDIYTKYGNEAPESATPVENGNMVMKYSSGMSLLYSPFFLAGHFITGFTSYPQDGFSYPYRLAMAIGSFVYTLLGLILLHILLLRYFNDIATAITLAIIVIGSNYLNYTAFDGMMTHNYLFTLYTIIILITIRWHEKPTFITSIILGASCGLAVLCRPTEVVGLLIPVLWIIYDKKSFLKKINLVKNNIPKVIIAMLCFLAIVSLQLFYWKTITGDWIFYSYRDQGFSFLKPHLINGLFSYKKGWFVYTPNMLFAIWGLYYLYQHYRHLFIPIAAFSLINLYIVFSWDIWWYGGSFGARAMVQSYAIWAFPLAAFTQQLINYKWAIKLPLMLLICSLSLLNLFQTYQAHAGIINGEGLTQTYYWKIFGATKVDPKLKKFFDVKYELSDLSAFNRNILFYTDFDSEPLSDSLMVTALPNDPKNNVYLASDSLQYTPPFIVNVPDFDCHKCWIRLESDYYFTEYVWNEWTQARLTLQLFNAKEQIVLSRSIRLQWIGTKDQWNSISLDYPIYKIDQTISKAAIYVENYPGYGRTVYLDNIKLLLLHKN